MLLNFQTENIANTIMKKKYFSSLLIIELAYNLASRKRDRKQWHESS